MKQTPDGRRSSRSGAWEPPSCRSSWSSTFDDGTTQVVKLPVEIWYGGNRYVYRVTPGKAIVRARVNPDGLFPDRRTRQRRLDGSRGDHALEKVANSHESP